MTTTVALQILTLIVALIGPFLAYTFARRLAVSGNRQAWLDALRTDVAHIIALKDNSIAMERLAPQNSSPAEKLALAQAVREKKAEFQAIRYRIRLRLRSGNPQHDRLIAAVEAMVKAKLGDARDPLRAEVVAATEAVVQAVWQKIEKGR